MITHKEFQSTGGQGGVLGDTQVQNVEINTCLSPVVICNVITANDGQVLTKTIRRDANGGIQKISGGALSYGTITSYQGTLEETARMAAMLLSNQMLVGATNFIGLDVPLMSEVERAKAGNPQGTVTRSKKHLRYEPGQPGLFVCDHDPYADSRTNQATPEALHHLLTDLFPAVFSEAARGCYYSSGSYIYDGMQELRGAMGHHTLYAVADASDLPRFKDALFRRLWLAGCGYIYIARDGKQMPRAIFDTTLLQPQQPVFSGGAVCIDGLEQRRPAEAYYPGGYLNTQLIQNLSNEEQQQYDQMVNQAKKACQPEADRVRREYIGDEVQRLREHCPDVSMQRAKRTVQSRIGGDLIGQDVLFMDDGTEVTVAEVLTDPGKYDHSTLADPLEPEYGGGRGKAIIYINQETGTPLINSQAHWGRVFHLRHDLVSLNSTIEKIKEDEGVAGVREHWLSLLDIADIRADERDVYLRTIKTITGIGIGSLREAIRDQEREREQAALMGAENAESLDDAGDLVARTVLETIYQRDGVRWLLQTEDRSFWCYTGTHWQRTSDVVVKQKCQEVANGRWRDILNLTSGPEGKSKPTPLSVIVDQGFKVLGTYVVKDGDPLHSQDQKLPVINCLNGEVWLSDERPIINAHDPAHGLTSCSNIFYDPDTTCPIFDCLLASMLSESGGVKPPDLGEMIRHVEELLGYAIQPSRFLKVFYLWIGGGDNGKTQLMKLVEAILGRKAIFHGRIDTMEDDKFRSVELHNKALGLDDDYSKGKSLPDGFIKKASERKTITAQYKGKDSFEFVLQVVLVILSNHFPPLKDLSRGMATRAQVIKFPRSFLKPNEISALPVNDIRRNDVQRPDLWNAVLDKELPGVLNKLIAGFYRVKNRGSFDEPIRCIEAREEWMNESRSLNRFLSTHLVKTEGEGRTENLDAIHDAYFDWCETYGIQERYRTGYMNLRKTMEEMGYGPQLLNGYWRMSGYHLNYVYSKKNDQNGPTKGNQ